MNRILSIAQVGHPVLREPTAELSAEMLQSAEMQQFIDDLIATMRAANGAGLAANQAYQSLRICAIEVRDNPRYPYRPNIPLTVLVNPVLTPVGDAMFENYEGCLSVPNLRGKVQRHCTFLSLLRILDRKVITLFVVSVDKKTKKSAS